MDDWSVSYSFSWTPKMDRLPFGYRAFTATEADSLETSLETVRLHTIDKIVENQLTFPDVDRILKNILDR